MFILSCAFNVRYLVIFMVYVAISTHNINEANFKWESSLSTFNIYGYVICGERIRIKEREENGFKYELKRKLSITLCLHSSLSVHTTTCRSVFFDLLLDGRTSWTHSTIFNDYNRWADIHFLLEAVINRPNYNAMMVNSLLI